MKTILITLAAAALLSACGQPEPEAAPTSPPPAEGSSQEFLDLWESNLTNPPVNTVAPPTSWEDLMLPPELRP